MTLTESTNICHFSDRFACTIIESIKEIFMGNTNIKDILEQKTCYLANLVFSEG